MTSMNIRTALDIVAQKLEQRGESSLAYMTDVVATQVSADEGQYQASGPLEKMIGEIAQQQAGKWIDEAGMKAIVKKLNSMGIQEEDLDEDDAYDNIVRVVTDFVGDEEIDSPHTDHESDGSAAPVVANLKEVARKAKRFGKVVSEDPYEVIVEFPNEKAMDRFEAWVDDDAYDMLSTFKGGKHQLTLTEASV